MSLRLFYRIVVLGTITILTMMMLFNVIDVLTGYGTKWLDWSTLVLFPVALICSLFAIGTMVLWLGMIWNCAFSNRTLGPKVAWLLLLIFTSTFGAFLYYFCVYNRERPNADRLVNTPATPA